MMYIARFVFAYVSVARALSVFSPLACCFFLNGVFNAVTSNVGREPTFAPKRCFAIRTFIPRNEKKTHSSATSEPSFPSSTGLQSALPTCSFDGAHASRASSNYLFFLSYSFIELFLRSCVHYLMPRRQVLTRSTGPERSRVSECLSENQRTSHL